MEYECKYCQRKFINDKFFNRHQKTFKFCVEYQNNFIKDELENLKKQKSLIEDEISSLNTSYENLIKEDVYLTSKDIENLKSKEIEMLFLNFEKDKNSIEDEYGVTLNKIVLKNNINENIGEYCNIDKLKIEKLTTCYSEFEKSKKDIECKYDKLIVAEKIFEEQEKIEEHKIQDQNTQKEIFEKYKNIQDENINKNLIIENELNDLINNKEIGLDHKLIIKKILNDIKDIKKNNENKIKKISSTINTVQSKKIINESNSKYDNSNSKYDNSGVFENVETGENNDEYLKEYEDIINKLIYHLNLLLSDYEMNNKNILYIIIQLFKFLNVSICNIPLDKIKIIINYVLKNYITNNNNIDDEYLKIFINKYLEHYIDILLSINNNEISIKNKKICFFPICY